MHIYFPDSTYLRKKKTIILLLIVILCVILYTAYPSIVITVLYRLAFARATGLVITRERPNRGAAL